MKNPSQLIFGISLAVLTTLAAGPTSAREYKMTTPIAPGVAVPDKLETSIGTLKLRDGFPNADTVEKIYDNLDRSRALQAYLRKHFAQAVHYCSITHVKIADKNVGNNFDLWQKMV